MPKAALGLVAALFLIAPAASADPVGPVYIGAAAEHDEYASPWITSTTCDSTAGVAVLEHHEGAEVPEVVTVFTGWLFQAENDCLGAGMFFQDVECQTVDGTLLCATSFDGTDYALKFHFASGHVWFDQYTDRGDHFHVEGVLSQV